MSAQSIIHKDLEDLKNKAYCIYSEIAKNFIFQEDYKISTGYCYKDYSDLKFLLDLFCYDICEIDYDIVEQKINKIQLKYDKECYSCVSNKKQVDTPDVICIPPTVENNFIEYSNGYTFNINSFTKGFTDTQGFAPNNIKIVSIPEQGELRFNNTLVTEGQVITLNQTNQLTFDLTNQTNIQDSISFIFQTSNTQCNLYSNMAIFTINSEAYINQAPSAVGDNTITVANRSTTTLTTAMFTSQTTPVYADPEGDNPQNLRIDTLGLDGQLLLNNVAVTAGQIIPFTDINAGLLTFVSPDQDPLDSDMFTFSISDTGSGLYSS